MEREIILNEVKKFFDIDELVCDHIYNKWKEKSWQFLDTNYLHCLLVIRKDIIKKPMYANGRSAHQKGMRCNRCDMVRTKSVPYISAHVLGKAGDFTIAGMTAETARAEIKKNANLLPCNVRIEGGVSWLHFDVMNQYGVKSKVYEFTA